MNQYHQSGAGVLGLPFSSAFTTNASAPIRSAVGVFARTSYSLFFSSLLFFSLFSISFSLPVAAETAYRWTDSAGRTIYGGKPPPNARNVEALRGRTYSKYSTSKLLRAYKKDPTPQIELKKPEVTVAQDPALEPHPEGTEPPEGERISVPSPAQLDHNTVELERDGTGNATSCKVRVTNYGEERASAITILFEFPDGRIIPSAGPKTLQPKEEGEYSVAQKDLEALKKSAGKNSGPAKGPGTANHEKEPITPTPLPLTSLPRVLIDFSSVPN